MTTDQKEATVIYKNNVVSEVISSNSVVETIIRNGLYVPLERSESLRASCEQSNLIKLPVDIETPATYTLKLVVRSTLAVPEYTMLLPNNKVYTKEIVTLIGTKKERMENFIIGSQFTSGSEIMITTSRNRHTVSSICWSTREEIPQFIRCWWDTGHRYEHLGTVLFPIKLDAEILVTRVL